MFDFKKILGGVRAALDDKNRKIAEKERELNALKSLPLPNEDIIAHLEKVIDKRAAQFGQAWDATIELLKRDPLGMDNIHHLGIITATPPGVSPSVLTMEVAILALFAEDIKAAIRKRVKTVPGGTGPSLAERSALIEKATSNLANLISERDELRREAAENGISL